jgi:transcription antitermination factor NusG
MNQHVVNWYVVYTRPKSERKVASSITDMGIESYLPMHRVVRQWSDRRKRIEVPLFPNYVFVRVTPLIRQSLYSIKEVVRFVSIEKRPVIVREKEIEAIQRVLGADTEVWTEEYFPEGAIVKVASGPFAGIEGVVVKKNNNSRLIIKVEGLMKAFSFNIAGHIAEPVLAEQDLATV